MSSSPDDEGLSTLQSQRVAAPQAGVAALTPVTNDDKTILPPPLRFLDLPLEIQQMIFRLLFIKDIYRDVNNSYLKEAPHISGSSQLLRVSRHFLNTGRPILLGDNLFDLRIGSQLHRIFRAIGRSGIPLLKQVRLPLKAVNRTGFLELKRCKGLQRLVLSLLSNQILLVEEPESDGIVKGWAQDLLRSREEVTTSFRWHLQELNRAKVTCELEYRLHRAGYALLFYTDLEYRKAIFNMTYCASERYGYSLELEDDVRMRPWEVAEA